MAIRIVLDLFVFLFGLILGSYFNVVVHRLPRGRSTVRPRSACPFCDGSIAARDNIPLLSYSILKGKCRRCGAPISPRYPLVEITTGFLLVVVVERFGLTTEALPVALFLCLLFLLALIDGDCFLLPDRLTLPGAIAGLALQSWIPNVTFLDALLGLLIGAGILILVMNFWYWIRQHEGMGMGDVNMLAMVGAFLGWKGVLVTLFVASLSGAVVGLGLMALGRLGMRSHLPFGVFLALGGACALFFGNAAFDLYLGQL